MVLLRLAGLAEGLVATIENLWDMPLRLYWEGPDDRVEIAQLAANGGRARQQVMPGDRLTYDVEGERHEIQAADEFVLLAPKQLYVLCDDLSWTVHPEWSPRGASRFLELVRTGYYDGVAIHRVVPKFLAQFGIKEERPSIKDDPPQGIKFEEGYASFAGAGRHSRSTEVFVVMPETPQHQLDAFGSNPWETPFAVVLNPRKLRAWENEYGDTPPWGSGPDPVKIRESGEAYLQSDFPNLKYVNSCKMVTEADLPKPESLPPRREEEVDGEFATPSRDRGRGKSRRSGLAAYGPPAVLVLLAVSLDYFRRREKIRRRAAAATAATPTKKKKNKTK